MTILDVKHLRWSILQKYLTALMDKLSNGQINTSQEKQIQSQEKR